MVKTLLKHELIYYFRTYGLFLPIVLVIAAAARVFRLFGDSNVISTIAIGSSTFVLIVSCFGLLALSMILSVVRFYKNMYSAEGYLTFTLPVTNSQHIFVKLFASWLFMAACAAAVCAAACIALSGQALVEVFDGISMVIDATLFDFGTGIGIVIFIEMILLLIISPAAYMLLYYACITIGQTAKKNRILLAFGVYFIYYIITQVIGTIFTMVGFILDSSGALDGVYAWSEAHSGEFLTLTLGFGLIMVAAMSALYWFVTQYVMTKKLNLE